MTPTAAVAVAWAVPEAELASVEVLREAGYGEQPAPTPMTTGFWDGGAA